MFFTFKVNHLVLQTFENIQKLKANKIENKIMSEHGNLAKILGLISAG